jgi:hypothetical protein
MALCDNISHVAILNKNKARILKTNVVQFFFFKRTSSPSFDVLKKIESSLGASLSPILLLFLTM